MQFLIFLTKSRTAFCLKKFTFARILKEIRFFCETNSSTHIKIIHRTAVRYLLYCIIFSFDAISLEMG